jgi:hypothetical protein
MKFDIKHFRFEFRPWRIDREGWKLYYEVVNTPHLKRNKFDNEWLKRVRAQYKASEVEAYVTHVRSGVSQQFTVKTNAVNRLVLASRVIDRIKGLRERARMPDREEKDWCGAPYYMTGGVFMQAEQINQIGKHPNLHSPLVPKKPRSKSQHYIGVELEFNENGTHNQNHIVEALKAANLGKYVCVGRDGSCGWEVRVLLPETNWYEPLENILKVINGLGFKADTRCGTHVHLDMRNRDVQKAFRRFFFTQTFMRKFLIASRKKNNYCKRNASEKFGAEGDRYLGINSTSYHKYKTLEIRMHHGTLDIKELGPWIKLLLRIANYQGDINKKVLTLKQAKVQYELDDTLTGELTERLTSLRKKVPVVRSGMPGFHYVNVTPNVSYVSSVNSGTRVVSLSAFNGSGGL